MGLDTGFLDAIEHPEARPLAQALSEAQTNTAERLAEMAVPDPEPWLVRKLAFAYFYDWQSDDPEYAFVLPDPGNLGKEYTDEVRHLRVRGPDVPAHDQVAFYRDLATTWLLDHQTDFPEQFITTLAAHGVIEYPDDWRAYIRRGDFFDDFYVTDVLKYRVNGYTTGSARESRAFRRQLKKELLAIDPDIIFVFGSSAWHTIRTYLEPEPVHSPADDETSIMDAHGTLYCTTAHCCAFVVPLGHMSGQVWWRFPPEDYVERLEEVLEELRDVAEDGFRPPEELCESASGPDREATALDKIAEEIGDVSEFGTRE